MTLSAFVTFVTCHSNKKMKGAIITQRTQRILFPLYPPLCEIISVARDYRFCYTIIERRGYTVPNTNESSKEQRIGNEKFKSSVFASYFSETHQRLIDLYNAFSTVEYPADTPLHINTLENALFYGLLNDISFVLDDMLIILIEHQSCARKQPEGCAA